MLKKVKIGIVKHLNARPLTYGFEIDNSYIPFYENPSVLKDLLLKRELDLALISSIECIRNEKYLSYSKAVGVCAKDKVRSILYFRNKTERFPPKEIFVDYGSRTSVALLKVLLNMETGKDIKTIPKNPKEILDMISQNKGNHLLFGDNALNATWNKEKMQAIDLANWWNRKTGFSISFAFWAYPKDKVYSDDIFIEKLEFGLKSIDTIINKYDKLPTNIIREYLTNELHFIVTKQDLDGFDMFQEKCRLFGYL